MEPCKIADSGRNLIDKVTNHNRIIDYSQQRPDALTIQMH